MDSAIAEQQSYLLASSGTLKGLEKLINEFYFSNSYVVDEATLAVRNLKTGKEREGVRVVKKGRRYRFEMLC